MTPPAPLSLLLNPFRYNAELVVDCAPDGRCDLRYELQHTALAHDSEREGEREAAVRALQALIVDNQPELMEGAKPYAGPFDAEHTVLGVENVPADPSSAGLLAVIGFARSWVAGLQVVQGTGSNKIDLDLLPPSKWVDPHVVTRGRCVVKGWMWSTEDWAKRAGLKPGQEWALEAAVRIRLPGKPVFVTRNVSATPEDGDEDGFVWRATLRDVVSFLVVYDLTDESDEDAGGTHVPAGYL